jgi:hypothetical protein
LEVLPFPGTPDVAAGAHIMFRALRRTHIGSVKVEGSASGRHRGVLEALPGGRGTEFVPDQPFSAGEHVTVSARLHPRGAGTASDALKAREVNYAFTVARPANVKTPARGGGFKPVPTQSFHSAPTLNPPVVNTTADADRSSGDVFADVRGGGQQGPMILDEDGGLVWFAPADDPQLSAFGVRVQRYRHRPVLTYWEGRLIPPALRGDGVGVILDRHYHRVRTITAGDGYRPYGLDEHEITLTSRSTALVSVTAPVHADLSPVGGPRNGVVFDSIIQEIDIATGKVVWEWHALGHVPLTNSYLGKPVRGKPYDFFHLNSIQQLPGGNLLISSRSTWAVYSINQRTGRINWEVGGKHSSLRMGPGTSFYWQHHAVLHRGGLLTVFNNGSGPRDAGPRAYQSQSRALEIRLSRGQATLVHAYQHIPPVLAGAQGSVQVLPNGNFLVGWGSVPEFSEYTPGGKKVWSGRFAATVQSYRVYRSTWHGRPSTLPAVTVSSSGDGALTVYASWNGATDVARWQLLAGSTKDNLSPRTSAPKRGFETAITANTSQRYLAVRALTRSGRVLGTSRVFRR